MNDDVRQQAYERAMGILRGRPGIGASLTPEQYEFVRSWSGPINLGDPTKFCTGKRDGAPQL